MPLIRNLIKGYEMKVLRKIVCAVLFALSFLPIFSQSLSQSERSKKAESLPKDITFWSKYDNEILAQAMVDRMTDEELLAQIFMFGWADAEPGNLLKSWVKRGLGSVKVFGWNTNNIQQVARSIKTLQTISAGLPFQIPLFVATDQEGGWIRHVKGETSDTPGNMAIGSSGYPMDAYYSGYYINREINVLGINMNFAPSIDLYTNLDSSVIGPRSFGADPASVGILGEAFMRGSIDAGVIPTAKHYPGHGDTSLDSHGRLPEIDVDISVLRSRELVPFKYLIQANVPAIMSGHLAFPQIEKDGTPASLSRKMLTDILRNELGYRGLIITDDMMMNGATTFAGSLTRAFTMAIEAGNDIIISSTTARLNENLWTKNLEYMKTSREFHDRVKDSAFRVIYYKLVYFKSGNAAPLYPDETKVHDRIPDREGEKFFLEQACRSVSMYKKSERFPYRPAEDERILVVGPFSDLLKECRKRWPDAAGFHIAYSLNSDQSNYAEWNAYGLEGTASAYDTIIINVFDAHSAGIAKRLKNSRRRVIVLSTMSPVYVINGFEWADTILCGYSYSSYSYKALVAALNGEFEVNGKIPLDFD